MKPFKQHLAEASYEVKINGLPDMYIDSKSPVTIKKQLRKQLRQPDDLVSITRITKGDKIAAFRDKIKSAPLGEKNVKEIGPAIGLAVRAAPYAVPAAIAVGRAVSAYSKGRSSSSGKKSAPKTTTAYSSKAPSAKSQREEVKLDEKMDPKDHVGPSKKNPDMYCVFDKDGKEHKLFKDKKDAEEYAVKNHDKLMGEGYSSFAQQKAVWANRKDGGKGHPDNKKKSKKENVDEISRDDLVKKVSSTIGSKVPTMLNPQSKEKNKVKTGLDRLRKALGPNHVMNQSATSEGLFFGKKGPAVVSRLARGVASRVTTKGKLDRAKKKQGKLDNKINLAKTRDSNKAKKAELRKMRTDRIKRAVGIGA